MRSLRRLLRITLCLYLLILVLGMWFLVRLLVLATVHPRRVLGVGLRHLALHPERLRHRRALPVLHGRLGRHDPDVVVLARLGAQARHHFRGPHAAGGSADFPVRMGGGARQLRGDRAHDPRAVPFCPLVVGRAGLGERGPGFELAARTWAGHPWAVLVDDATVLAVLLEAQQP